MTSKRPTCVWCDKPYGRRANRSEEVRWPNGEPMPPYRGNGVVTKTGKPSLMNLKADWIAERDRRVKAGYLYERAHADDQPDPRFYTDTPTMHAYREVWDGETYWKPYDPFCTLQCSLAYARNAYKRAAE